MADEKTIQLLGKDQRSVQLNNGVSMPMIGFGTYTLTGETCRTSLQRALCVGYRLVDTASVYKNEADVGHVLRECMTDGTAADQRCQTVLSAQSSSTSAPAATNTVVSTNDEGPHGTPSMDRGPPHQLACAIKRNEVFVTTKISPREMKSYDDVVAALHRSLNALGLAYVDLYLMHWPAISGKRGKRPEESLKARHEAWRAMADMQKKGLCRCIGISNFVRRHIEPLPEPVPQVCQIELHGLCRQEDVVACCRERGIHVQAYSPLGCGSASMMGDESLAALAKGVGLRTPAPLLLAAAVALDGFSVIPRATTHDHQVDNLVESSRLLATDSLTCNIKVPVVNAARLNCGAEQHRKRSRCHEEGNTDSKQDDDEDSDPTDQLPGDHNQLPTQQLLETVGHLCNRKREEVVAQWIANQQAEGTTGTSLGGDKEAIVTVDVHQGDIHYCFVASGVH